jgi:hypothetical protein
MTPDDSCEQRAALQGIAGVFFGTMMGMLQSEDSEESWIEARHYDRKTGRETCSAPTALVWMRFRRSQSGNHDPFQRIIAKR